MFKNDNKLRNNCSLLDPSIFLKVFVSQVMITNFFLISFSGTFLLEHLIWNSIKTEKKLFAALFFCEMSLKMPGLCRLSRQLALQDHNYVSKIPPPPLLPLPLHPIEKQFQKNSHDLSSQPSSTKIENIILPEEVWILIWSYLDFNIVQKICSRVSKSWMEMIRNSKLSWEMKLQIINYKDDAMDVIALRDFNSLLFHWDNLRVLHFSSEPEFARFRKSLSLNSHESLEKIVIPARQGLLCRKETKFGSTIFTSWGVVTKYWMDPRHILDPDTVKNVITLKIYLDRLPDDFDMRQSDCDLTNLETLEICDYEEGERFWIPNTKMLSKFSILKELVMCLEIHIDRLPHIARFLGNTNNLKISGTVKVRSDIDEEETREFFNEALKILREKFPFPDRRILDLKLYEDEEYFDTTTMRFSITYGESGATLTTSEDNSDYEYENSDSLDESDEYFESLVDSDENPNSMDESDEHADSMAESDKDSENEYHMNDPDHDYRNNGMMN